MKESPFARSMTAIPANQRAPHLATIEKLFRKVQCINELPDGYSFRLPNDSDVLRPPYFSKLSLLATYNGVNVHRLLIFTHDRHALSLIMVKGRDPGMSYSVTL